MGFFFFLFFKLPHPIINKKLKIKKATKKHHPKNHPHSPRPFMSIRNNYRSSIVAKLSFQFKNLMKASTEIWFSADLVLNVSLNKSKLQTPICKQKVYLCIRPVGDCVYFLSSGA